MFKAGAASIVVDGQTVLHSRQGELSLGPSRHPIAEGFRHCQASSRNRALLHGGVNETESLTEMLSA